MAKQEAGGAGDSQSTLRETLVKILTGLATTAGVVAFVAASGAALTWAELRGADLPATRALQVIPRTDLLVFGQINLLVFVVLGLLAVVVAYGADPEGRATDGLRSGLAALVSIEVIVAVLLVDEDYSKKKTVAILLLVLAGALSILAAVFTPVNPRSASAAPDTKRGRLRLRLERLMDKLTRREPIPITLAEIDRAEALKKRGHGDGKPEQRYRREINHRGAGLGIAGVLVLTVILGALFSEHWWVAASLPVAIALAGVCVRSAEGSGGRFLPYGLTVFFSVVLFGAALNLARNLHEPRVEPAALIRKSETGVSGVVGFFITKTDTHYWLAAQTFECEKSGTSTSVPVRHIPGTARVFSVPANQVIADVVGSPRVPILREGSHEAERDHPVSPRTAGDRALDLLAELVRRQPPGGAAKPVATATPTAAASPQTVAAAATATPPPAPPDMEVDDAAIVPTALAMTGQCIKPPARLVSLEPRTAAPGDTVRIIGTDLGTNADKGEVTLDGSVELKTSEWDDHAITFTVPAEARTGRVGLRVRRRVSNSLLLTIQNQPPVAAFAARRADAGARRFTLDAGSSIDPERGKLQYHWRSSSGGVGAADREITTYRISSGQRRATITLTVTDDQGQSSARTRRLVACSEAATLPESRDFNVDESTLTDEGRSSVENLKRRIEPDAALIRRVTIYGYADFTGTDAYNDDLSMARARAVEEVLLTGLDVAENKLDVRGFGEREAKSKRLDDPGRASDRRVDVSVMFRCRSR